MTTFTYVEPRQRECVRRTVADKGFTVYDDVALVERLRADVAVVNPGLGSGWVDEAVAVIVSAWLAGEDGFIAVWGSDGVPVGFWYSATEYTM